jgi:hypothetical protein
MTATRPQTEADNFVDVAGRRFLVDTHPDGWFFTCTECGMLIPFGNKAMVESVRCDLALHECSAKAA